jgi:hypothetical protein
MRDQERREPLLDWAGPYPALIVVNPLAPPTAQPLLTQSSRFQGPRHHH